MIMPPPSSIVVEEVLTGIMDGTSKFAPWVKCTVLVPHHTGLSLDQVEDILKRQARQHH